MEEELPRARGPPAEACSNDTGTVAESKLCPQLLVLPGAAPTLQQEIIWWTIKSNGR